MNIFKLWYIRKQRIVIIRYAKFASFSLEDLRIIITIVITDPKLKMFKCNRQLYYLKYKISIILSKIMIIRQYTLIGNLLNYVITYSMFCVYIVYICLFLFKYMCIFYRDLMKQLERSYWVDGHFVQLGENTTNLSHFD